MVAVDAAQFASGQRLAHGVALDERHQRDQRRVRRQVAPKRQIKERRTERRQSGRNSAHGVEVETKQRRGRRGANRDDHWAGATERMAVAQLRQQRRGVPPHNPQETEAGGAHGHGHRVEARQRLDEGRGLGAEIRARAGADADHGRKLADENQNGGGVDEAADDRMAEQARQAAQPAESQEEEKHAHLGAQHNGDVGVALRVGGRVAAHRGGDHQRRDGHGPHHHLPR